jgi:hypothetical protein
MEKTADNTFEPADSDQLIKAACAFLKDEVLTEGQELSTGYARPARVIRSNYPPGQSLVCVSRSPLGTRWRIT